MRMHSQRLAVPLAIVASLLAFSCDDRTNPTPVPTLVPTPVPTPTPVNGPFDGEWAGTALRDGVVLEEETLSFRVDRNSVMSLGFGWGLLVNEFRCEGGTFAGYTGSVDPPLVITDNSFTLTREYVGGQVKGSLVIEGRFDSATTASGTGHVTQVDCFDLRFDWSAKKK